MTSLLPLVLALGVQTADAAPKGELPKVLVLSLEAAGVAPEEAKVLDGMVANALSAYSTIEVVTSEDLAQMMELEGQRQQLGCDTKSCLAEIAGAMGARYVVFGSAGRLGELFVVQLNLFDSVEAKAVERREIQAAAVEGLATQVRPAVADLLRKVTDEEVEAEPIDGPSASGGGLGPLLWTGLGTTAVGALTLAGGGAALAVGAATLGSPSSDRVGKDIAVVLMPVGIGALVTGGVITLAGGTVALVAVGVE